MELAIGTMQNNINNEITGCSDEPGTSGSTTNKEIVRENVIVNEPMNESTIDTCTKEEEGGGGGTYLPYDPTNFSMQIFYRPQHDIVAACMVDSGMEGIDRSKISKRLGINANCKAGNRIVSSSIHTVLKTHPKLFGVFQKMEGRFRVKKYYLKNAENAPGGRLVTEYLTRFKNLTGRECPCKLGEVIKFPGHNINTLRISDVTLRRLVQILEYIYEEKAVITANKLGHVLTAMEHEEGYNFTIDRKSLRKLLLVLAQHRFLNLMEMEIDDRNQTHKVEVITIPNIRTIDNPVVKLALEKIINEYKDARKSFPQGIMLKKEPVEKQEKRKEVDDEKDANLVRDGEEQFKTEPEEDGQQKSNNSGSLLYNTFNTLERIQMQTKYGKSKPAFSMLSQKTIHTLVDAARRRRRLAKSGKQQPKQKKATKKGQLSGQGTSLGTAHLETTSTNPEKNSQKRSYSYGSRLVDNVDRISLQHKAYLRSRFSQRERDMLLLIRACSFFLNPINRFWPNPKVLRNIMHEFVPESRTKTTYSLMAAGVRELKDRQSQQQYIVKTLASYPELLTLRNELVQLNLSTSSQSFVVRLRDREEEDLRPKDLFFVDAFRIAYKLLFKETDNFPSIDVNDHDFTDYLYSNHISFISVSDGGNTKTKKSPIPPRSKKPIDEEGIRTSIAYNTIMLILHTEEAKMIEEITKGSTEKLPIGSPTSTQNLPLPMAMDISNFLIEQIGLMTLSETIEKIRADGLITKNRPNIIKPAATNTIENAEHQTNSTIINLNELGEEPQSQQQKSDEPFQPMRLIRITQFYKHYFDCGLHRNLAKNIVETAQTFIADGVKEQFGQNEDPAEFMIMANRLCDPKRKMLDFTTPNSLNELFVLQKTPTYGEEGDLGQGPSTSDALNLTANATATKQLRYLEDSELRLELIHIKSETLGFDETFDSAIDGLPSLENLLKASDRLIPVQKMPPTEHGNAIDESNSSINNNETPELAPVIQTAYEKDPSLKRLYNIIDQTRSKGITEEELMAFGLCADLTELQNRLEPLLDSSDIFICGVDKRRFVSTRNGQAWLLRNMEGQGFVPKPWSLPNGKTNWMVISWMLEGLFHYIYANPGLTLDNLLNHYSFVLQPSFTFDLLEMLQKIGCCIIKTKQLHSMHKASPFEKFSHPKLVKFVQACPNGMEKIILFKNFKRPDEATVIPS